MKFKRNIKWGNSVEYPQIPYTLDENRSIIRYSILLLLENKKRIKSSKLWDGGSLHFISFNYPWYWKVLGKARARIKWYARLGTLKAKTSLNDTLDNFFLSLFLFFCWIYLEFVRHLYFCSIKNLMKVASLEIVEG